MSQTCPALEWFPLRWQLTDHAPSDHPLHGCKPLPWWSAGWYCGAQRERILRLREQPEPELLRQPLQPLLRAWTAITASNPVGRTLVLVPIPTWRQRPNPVPQLLATSLLHKAPTGAKVVIRPELLLRSRRVKTQHRLARAQRWRNQWLSFRALLAPEPAETARRTVLLIDDVLTSGATALAAQQALQSAGWSVAALLCLARTPRAREGRDLRFAGQGAAAPGTSHDGPG